MPNGGISVTGPISRAIDRAKFIAFQPFDLGKWFTLGFIAFLASLGQAGGNVNFNFRGFGGGPRPVPRPAPLPGPGGGPSVPQPSEAAPFDEILQWMSSHRAETALIAAGILIVIVAVTLLVLWVSSRAQFMFLEAIANGTYEVKAPWKRYRTLGNSLFSFRVLLALVSFAAVLMIGAVALAIAWTDIGARRFGASAGTAVVVGVVTLAPTIVVLALVGWCTDQFVTTIMYATGQPVVPAWGEFRRHVLRGHVGPFVLFLLMQIVLGLACAIVTVVAGCATCCVGFLPYLSSVLTLPLSVFMRSYSVYFLQQFDARYVIIREPPPPPPRGAFPVVPLPPGQPYPQYPAYPQQGNPYPQYPQQYPQAYPPAPPPPPTR